MRHCVSRCFVCPAQGSEPLFVSKVLASIWTAYDAIALNHMPARVDKIVSSLGLSVDQREITQVSPVAVYEDAGCGATLEIATGSLSVVSSAFHEALEFLKQ